MGLFGDLEGAVGGLLQGKAASLLPMVEQALGDNGGVNGLLAQLQGSGLGAQVASWLGNGSNQPISAAEIEQALSSQQVQSLAASLGVDTGKVGSFLAQMLPAAVDQASPDGTLTPPAA